jgi:hypothetical protein
MRALPARAFNDTLSGMSWGDVRRLILPTALTVTSIAVTLACGSDGESKTPALVQCSEVPSAACQKCLTPDGGVDCAASPTCFYDPGDDACHDGVA